MLIDHNSLKQETTLNTDICVIGAGAGGIALVKEMLSSNKEILLMESGGTKYNSKLQEYYKGTVTHPDKHGALDKYRRKVFGGTTSIWGGRCAPFDSIDFEHRDQIPYTGWPIERDEIIPYYIKAHEILDLGAFDYSNNAIEEKNRFFVEGFESNIFKDKIWRFSMPTDLGKKYFRDFKSARNLKVVLGAECYKLNATPQTNNIESADFLTHDGKKIHVIAQKYVLACGGLENTRFLLGLCENDNGSFFNIKNNLGKFYMSHLSGTYGHIKLLPSSRKGGWKFLKTKDGVYSKPRLLLKNESLKKGELINISFILDNHPPHRPEHKNSVLSSLYLAKIFFTGRIPPEYSKALSSSGYSSLRMHLLNILKDPVLLITFHTDFIYKRFFKKRRIPGITLDSSVNEFFLHFDCEQSPCEHSTVKLNKNEKDKLGRPKLIIDWNYNERDVKSIIKSYELLKDELQKTNIAEIDVDLNSLREYLNENLSVGSHHIGTTKMATSDRDGVVDINCKVFGSSNLFISGPSVFPTAGCANPVLTIVALAIRLAEYLKTE